MGIEKKGRAAQVVHTHTETIEDVHITCTPHGHMLMIFEQRTESEPRRK